MYFGNKNKHSKASTYVIFCEKKTLLLMQGLSFVHGTFTKAR